MLNALAQFLLLFLKDILISMVAFFFLDCYAEYIIYRPLFEEKNDHQLRTKNSISILSTNITSNVFSCGRKFIFTKIKAPEPVLD